MNLENLLNRIERYTDIPRLAFQFESDEYVYIADTMNHVNYILKNLAIIEGNKKNLKKYKDDPETVRNIKENIKYYEETIENSLEVLEENYKKHNRTLKSLSNYNEDVEEEELWQEEDIYFLIKKIENCI